jgi:hypothetical protein
MKVCPIVIGNPDKLAQVPPDDKEDRVAARIIRQISTVT